MRGLKLDVIVVIGQPFEVAPYVGAWIETDLEGLHLLAGYGRTLRGCVD